MCVTVQKVFGGIGIRHPFQKCFPESTRPDFIGVLENLWSEFDDLDHYTTEALS